MSLAMRVATEADAETLASLGRATFLETWVDTFAMGYDAAELAVYLDQEFSVAKIRRQIADERNRWFVATLDHEVIAYAFCGPCGLPHPDASTAQGELKRLYVSKKHHNAGAGRLLLEASLAWLRDSFTGPLWLGVWSGNEKAQRLYHRYGFSKVGEYVYRVGSSRDHEFIFRCERVTR